MKFGIHNSSWLDTPDPAEAFETVKAKAQRAEETHLQFSPKVFFNRSPLPVSVQKRDLAKARSPCSARISPQGTAAQPTQKMTGIGKDVDDGKSEPSCPTRSRSHRFRRPESFENARISRKENLDVDSQPRERHGQGAAHVGQPAGLDQREQLGGDEKDLRSDVPRLHRTPLTTRWSPT